MKLKEFKDILDNLVDTYPGLKEAEVLYSIDDVGSAFCRVEDYPTIGTLHEDGMFIPKLNSDTKDITAICIN